MTNRLTPILAAKREHVAACKSAVPYAEIVRRAADLPPTRAFAAALRSRIDAGRYALIAEIKCASPSKGVIRPSFDPPALARAYQAGGATCLSVLTDTPYFQGADEYLVTVRQTIELPILRKDFTIDPYQIAEARNLGADCILLIMAALTDAEAGEFYDTAASFGLDALIEVHDAEELERALTLKPAMIGINNRNLKTLEVDITTSLNLSAGLPDSVIRVAESGLSTPADLANLAEGGILTFLIGEALLRQDNVTLATQKLLVDRP